MEYNSNKQQVMRELHRKKVKALHAIGAFVEGEAKVRTPVRTGNLRSSYTYEINAKEGSVTIGTNVFYAPYLEYGTGVYAEGGQGRGTPWSFQDQHGNWFRTVGTRPRPMIRPAIKNNKDRIETLTQAAFRW